MVKRRYHSDPLIEKIAEEYHHKYNIDTKLLFLFWDDIVWKYLAEKIRQGESVINLSSLGRLKLMKDKSVGKQRYYFFEPSKILGEYYKTFIKLERTIQQKDKFKEYIRKKLNIARLKRINYYRTLEKKKKQKMIKKLLRNNINDIAFEITI